MSNEYFHSTIHIIQGQHIREYANSTAGSNEDILNLEIKQYVPHNNLPQNQGAEQQSAELPSVTIIAAHANSFPKELYEPLWDTVLEESRSSGARYRVRSIWIADMVNQNASGVLNEKKLGDEFHWFDHSRDLLRMIDVFRDEMPLPLVGIGHSVGGAVMVGLSQMHPRLFSNLILLEPQITIIPMRNLVQFVKQALQPDLWSSRQEAEASIRKNLFYKRWDPRVLNRYIQLLFRDTPTTLYPGAPAGSVTKRTSNAQAFFSTAKRNYQNISMQGRPASAEERRINPDVDSRAPFQYPWYASAPRQAFYMLPTLRPAVHFIHGEQSPSSFREMRKARVESCGIGYGGNGGIELGRVKESLLPSGHFLPFDMVRETGKIISDYLNDEIPSWKDFEDRRLESWNQRSLREKQTLSKEDLEHLKIFGKETEKLVKSLSSTTRSSKI